MTAQPRIYLDHAATTPIRPEARAAMIEAMERWANPSSPHAEGRAARAALEEARDRIKHVLGWSGDLIFTSGASEAIDIAMKRSKLARRIAYATEHDAVFRAAPDAEMIAPFADEHEPDDLIERLRGGPPAIVAIQAINPETGFMMMGATGKPHPIYKAVQEAGGLVLRDFAQWSDMWDMDKAWGDFIAVSGHKIGGPIGVGALLVRDLSLLHAVGGQERGYRFGTENLPAIMGFAAAIEASQASQLYGDPSGETRRVGQAMFDFGEFMIEQDAEFVPGIWRDASSSIGGGKVARIAAVTMPHFSAQTQLIRFDQMGFAVSAGSACSSGSMKPSRVLKAFGVSDDVAARTIRVSFGWTTTVEEIEAFKHAWLELADEGRSRAA